MGLLLMLHNLKNCLPFKSEDWKIIFHILSYLVFLPKSHKDLHEKWGKELKDLVSLSTTLWRDQLQWLGHSQNSIEFSWWDTKKFCSVNLKGMWCRVKYLFCSMDWVGDDKIFWYFWRCGSLIYITSDSKQFSFCTIDIYHMVKGFDNRFVVNVYISNRCSHIIFDTSVCDDKCMRRVFWWRKS